MNAGEATAAPDAPNASAPEPGTSAAEALARAERAFELGDFAAVRRIARPLFTSESREVADAARALHRRVSVDPAQVAVVIGCLAVLVAIVARYVF